MIALVAAAFFATPLVFWLAPSEVYGIVWLLGVPMSVLVLAVAANKLLQARRAARWPQAGGRITKSEVAATRHKSMGEATAVTNLPAVEYEFSVKGRKFTGTRIAIGDDTGGANTEATLAHYPVGAAVMVYYDPDDPGNCVLEREIPKGAAKGCAAILLVLAALGIGGYWLVVHSLDVVEAYAEAHGLTLGTGIAGLLALLLFVGSVVRVKETVGWPSVRGRIEESGTESFRKRVEHSTVTYYAPAVEFSYVVNGHAYRSRQIELGVTRAGSLENAQQIAARYPKGRDVEVHYDPANPGNAALENRGIGWYLLVIAVACFGVAIYAGGVLG